MSNLPCTRADGRTAYVQEKLVMKDAAKARAVASALPTFPPPVTADAGAPPAPREPSRDPSPFTYRSTYGSNGPQPDWDAADRAAQPVKDEWSALPPIPKREKDWRHDEAYCAALAAWIVDSIYDRVDTIPLWNVHGKDGNGVASWFRPTRDVYDERSVALALQHAFRGTGGSKHYIVGAYSGDPVTGKCRAQTSDIDGHKEGDTPDADLALYEAFCQAEGIPYFLASSKGNNGSHPRVLFSEGIPRLVTHNFGNLIKKLAGLPAKTEVNPKTPHQTAPFGSQVAIFGSRYFFEKTGGSMIIRNGTHENVPFEEWLSYLSSVPKMSLADVLAFGFRHGVDLREEQGAYARKVRVVTGGDLIAVAPPPRGARELSGPADRGFAPRGHDISTLQAFVTFLTEKGYAPTRVRPDGPGCYKVAIPRCVLEEEHSSKTDDPVLFYDESLGAIVWHKCLHASCNAVEKLTASAFLRRVGCEVEHVHRPAPHVCPAPAPSVLRPPEIPAVRGTGEQVIDDWSALPPVPTPCGAGCGHDHDEIPERWLEGLEPSAAGAHSKLRHYLYTRLQRDNLFSLASLQCKTGSVERKRGLRAACCGEAQRVRWCPTHGKVHACPLSCGRAGVCVSCSSPVGINRHELVRAKWADAGWVTIDVGRAVALSDPGLAYRSSRRSLARLQWAIRKRRIRGRRWFIGVHTVAVAFLNPDDAEYVADLLGRDTPGLTAGTLSPIESADKVHALTMEPALVLAQLLETAEGTALAADFPFLVEKHARRTGAGLKGEQLPWLSEEEFAEAARERARERAIARGEDPDAFDADRCQRGRQGPDGRVVKCGEPLRNAVEVDGIEIAAGRVGGAAWRVADAAFAVLAAQRTHARSTTLRTT